MLRLQELTYPEWHCHFEWIPRSLHIGPPIVPIRSQYDVHILSGFFTIELLSFKLVPSSLSIGSESISRALTNYQPPVDEAALRSRKATTILDAAEAYWRAISGVTGRSSL